MNDCIIKHIEQIREENAIKKKTKSDRKVFLRSHEKEILDLKREGAETSEIARILNQCNGTDLTKEEVKEFQNERKDSLFIRVFLVCCFLGLFLDLFALSKLDVIAHWVVTG